MAAKCIYKTIPVFDIEDYRGDLDTGSVGDFDRLVADGYSPEEAHEMIVDGEV